MPKKVPPPKRTFPKPSPRPKPKPKVLDKPPADYLRGSKTVGENYTAWDTYGQGKPDFGKGKGPGDPYREVTKKVQTPLPKPPNGKPAGDTGYGRLPIGRTLPARVGPLVPKKKDLRLNAIKRRLGAL